MTVNFKVNTVGRGQQQPADEPFDQGFKNQEVDEYINDFFDQPTNSTEGSEDSPDSGIDPRLTLGDINEYGTVITDLDADARAEWFREFPPDIDQILSGPNNEHLINYIELFIPKYEKIREDLDGMIQKLTENQKYMSVDEAEVARQHLQIFEQCLGRTNNTLEARIPEIKARMDQIWLQEKTQCRDLDGNGWWGRPYYQGSYYGKEQNDGTMKFWNFEGVRVSQPFMAPDYNFKLADNSLKIIEEQYAVPPSDSPIDCYLRLTENAMENNPNGIPIGTPEFLWVELDPKATGSEQYKKEWDGDAYRMFPAEFTTDSTGAIVQNISEKDRPKYVQVKVDEMIIRSEKSEVFDPSNTDIYLYNHIIEFKNKGNVLGRARIEGREFPTDYAAAVNWGGDDYVAASSVLFRVIGDWELAGDQPGEHGGRWTPIIFDASGLISTGFHKFDDLLWMGLDVENGRPGDGKPGDMAWTENTDPLTKENFTTYSCDVESGLWNDAKEYTRDYEGYNDIYVAANAVPPDGATLLSRQTGIAVDGLCGALTLTPYWDMARVATDFSDAAKEHIPKKLRQIGRGDATYNNVVEAGGGNNIVTLDGKGNTYMTGVTLADIRGSNANDRHHIATPDVRTGSGRTSVNAKVWINVDEGAQTFIFNPLEYDPLELSDDDDQDAFERLREAMGKDDYFNAPNAIYCNPDAGAEIETYGDVGGDLERAGLDAITGEARAKKKELRNAIQEMLDNEKWDIEDRAVNMGEAGKDALELDAFFNELSTEFGGFVDEIYSGL